MAHTTRGTRTNHPSDVSDEEWAFCAPYLTLLKENAPQRDYPMRAMFNAVRSMVRAGCPRRMIPNGLPRRTTVHQQAQRWIKASCFVAMIHDLRKIVRLLVNERDANPSTVSLDGRTLQSTPESGERAGYVGYKRKKGIEGPFRSRHPGSSPGSDSYCSQRAGTRSGSRFGKRSNSRAETA